MNYEEKYKKALATARKLYNMRGDWTNLEIESIFPELRESEDEGIRKEILNYIIKGSESYYDVQQYGREKFEKWIAWLKKQGKWSEEDEDTIKFLISHFCTCYPNRTFQFTTNEVISHDELLRKIRHLRPQPQWKPSKEQIKGIECAIKTLQHQLNVRDKRLNSLYDDLKQLMEE